MGYFLHLLQLLSTCVAFSLVAGASTLQVAAGNWSIFVWCFCFIVTLIILIVELCGLQPRLHLSWDGFLITSASCATFLCLSGSIVFATACIQLLPHSPFGDHAIAVTAFSSLAHRWSPNAFTQTQVIPIPKALAVATPPANGRDEATCLRSQIYSVLGSELECRQAGSRAHRLSQPAVHSPGLGSSLLSWAVALYTGVLAAPVL